MPEMPLYTCHKEVRAAKIAAVDDLGTDSTTDENPIVLIHFEDSKFEPRKFNLRGKPAPEAGWWLVKYPDGYESFSPAKAFEEGYKLKGCSIRFMRRTSASSKLSPREREVLDLLLENGADEREMSVRLKISRNTLSRHMRHIYEKTGYATRTELAVNELHKRYAAAGKVLHECTYECLVEALAPLKK